MTSRTPLRAVLAVAALAAAVLPAGPSPARAESRAEEDVTPLALVRRSAIVVVARGAANAPEAVAGTVGTLIVEESLRGSARVGDRLAVASATDREDARVPEGGRWLAFADPRPDGRWTLVGGGLGMFDLPAGPAGEATLSLFRTLAPHAAEGRSLEGASAVAVRTALVQAARTGHDRTRSGAALDLLREPGLLAGCGETERESLAAAFRETPSSSRARGHLARALGILKHPATGALLAEAVAASDGGLLKRQAGLALKDLDDGAAVRLMAAKLAGANPAVRVAVAGALGWSGRPEARSALESLLADASVPVRFEAIIGLGRLRDADAAPALLVRFRKPDGSTPGPEADTRLRRAVAWALAQCDTGDAWSALRTARDEDPELGYRSFLSDLLANPRREFVR
jgi:HEAT repeat protein